MTWIEAVPSGLALLTAFFLPGAVFLLVARVPWQIAVSVAPAVSVFMASIGAVVTEPLGLAWGLATFAVVSVVMIALAWLVGRWVQTEKFDLPPSPHAVWASFGLMIAAPVAVLPLMLGFGAPDAPALTGDAVFHLNALRHIAETGDASMLTLGRIAAPDASLAYYPGGWHDIVSVVIGDAPMALYANLATLVIVGVVYPVGLILLAASIFPTQPVILLVAPVLGSSFVAFPARMFTFGTLWPSGLSTALLPAVIALVILLFSTGKTGRQRILMSLTLMAALGGAVAAHPTALFATVLLTAPYLLWRGWGIVTSRWRNRPIGRRSLVFVLVAVSLLLVIAAALIPRLPQVRSLFSYSRRSLETQPQAVGEALFDAMLGSVSYGNTGAYLVIGVLTILGIIVATRHRNLIWLIFSYGASVGFFALAAGPETRLRALVAAWYKDPVRLGGLVPLFATLLASLAVVVIIEYMSARVTYVGERMDGASGQVVKQWSPGLTAVLMITVLFLASGWFRAAERRTQAEDEYIRPLTSENSLLSTPELEMIERLSDELPTDAVILGNPKNGSALVYAITGRHVIFAHIKGSFGADREQLARTFEELETNPEVCDLLSEFDVTHFYDDSDIYNQGRAFVTENLNAENISDGLELVDSGGTARLYRITACEDNE